MSTAPGATFTSTARNANLDLHGEVDVRRSRGMPEAERWLFQMRIGTAKA
jgi:hypothetical protein